MRRRRDVALGGEVREERDDLVRPHVARVTLCVEENEAAHPVDVDLLGAMAVVLVADRLAHLFEKAGLGWRMAILLKTAQQRGRLAGGGVGMVGVAMAVAVGGVALHAIGLYRFPPTYLPPIQIGFQSLTVDAV